ncbi:MAG: TIGR01777 family oxidoreductase [Acidimicrobiales bacterium]
MRVGVTGASGFIGQALTQSLRARGDTVVRFVRPTTPPASGPTIRWDPARALVDESDLRDVRRLDAIVNLAGVGIGDQRWNARRKQSILSSRVQSTALLAHVARTLPEGLGSLVSASAVGWYGDRGDERLDESSSGGVGFLAEVCQEWEGATQPLSDLGVGVAHVRTGIVLSTRGGALARQLPMFRLGLGATLSTGRQWMSPIALSDEIRALEWVLDHTLTGPVNLVGPTPVTNADFAHLVASSLQRPAFLRIPKVALRAGLGRDMADQLLLASQHVEPARLVESGFVFEYPNAHAALAAELSSR